MFNFKYLKLCLGLALLPFAANVVADEQETCCKEKVEMCNNHISFPYIDLGASLLFSVFDSNVIDNGIPTIGLGYRMRGDILGGDISLHGGSCGMLSTVKAAVDFQQYFGSSSNLYVFEGANVSWLYTRTNFHHGHISHSNFLVAPEVGIGQNLFTKSDKVRFWQLGVSYPLWDIKEKETLTHNFIVSVSYGFAF